MPDRDKVILKSEEKERDGESAELVRVVGLVL
jgi:hypothetical protein